MGIKSRQRKAFEKMRESRRDRSQQITASRYCYHDGPHHIHDERSFHGHRDSPSCPSKSELPDSLCCLYSVFCHPKNDSVDLALAGPPHHASLEGGIKGLDTAAPLMSTCATGAAWMASAAGVPPSTEEMLSTTCCRPLANLATKFPSKLVSSIVLFTPTIYPARNPVSNGVRANALERWAKLRLENPRRLETPRSRLLQLVLQNGLEGFNFPLERRHHTLYQSLKITPQ